MRRNDFILHSSRPARGCVFSALLSAHLDAMDVVDQTVEDAIRDGAIADLLVPARDRQLGSEAWSEFVHLKRTEKAKSPTRAAKRCGKDGAPATT